MTIDRLLRGIRDIGTKGIACTGIGLTLVMAGCSSDNKASEMASYANHQVTIEDLKKEPERYLDRKVSLTATPLESNTEYTCYLSVVFKEGNQYLVGYSYYGNGKTLIVADTILDAIVAENNRGVMRNAVVNGVFRKDEAIGYWLDLNWIKKIDEEFYLKVGVPGTYKEWVEPKKSEGK